MTSKLSSATEFTHTSPAAQSPESSITQSQDEIWITVQNLVGESIEFGGELSADVLAGEQRWIRFDPRSTISTEPLKPIRGGMDLKYIGAVYFWMGFPNAID